MMNERNQVAAHYAHGSLCRAIEDGITRLGKTRNSVTVDDLASVDEFHIGGRQASIAFLDQLGLAADEKVLDIGCGIGGAARFVAQHYSARIVGVDLTAEYVAAGRELCAWLGLSERVEIHESSALAMPFEPAQFDRAYMMHVGMNIADKQALFHEVARVLSPGAKFGVYDVMRIGEGNIEFPVPWAATAETSAVATPEHYTDALTKAGFKVLAERNRREFALEFFEQLRTNVAAPGGAPPLGLHILMGDTASLKRKNMLENISKGRIAPVEIIVEKAEV